MTIIGAGVSSVFLAYTLMKENEDLTIHIIDKGKKLSERSCGTDSGLPCTCNGNCEKYIGFAGLGMSEGKFNYTNDFGGELARKIGAQRTLNLMREVDDILCFFGGAQREKYRTINPWLSHRAAQYSLKVLSTETRHLGSILAKEIFQKMYEEMENRIHFTFEADVHKILKNETFLVKTDRGEFTSRRLVLATGKSGSEWLKDQTEALGIVPGETRLDLGIRVEMRGNQLDSILGETFETKLKYETETFSATTYCMNPQGRIIRKRQHGLVMADGQNQKEEETPSGNLNFTLFVPRYFPTYEKAMLKARQVIGNINQDRERIVVQRLRDLKNNSSTDVSSRLSIQPSLNASGGNLHDEVPSLYVDALLEFFSKLEALIGEQLDQDTLLYGIDAKFYEPKNYTDPQFMTQIPGLFLIGDCSGETHSLSQAAASGIYLGQELGR